MIFHCRLKRQRTIPEKDAKAILMQIVSGLRYLSHPFTYYSTNEDGVLISEDNPNYVSKYPPKKNISIIHYDLKPANILFDEKGDVKITDFGLAKVINEAEEGTSMELTSLGAGTYWYLPPECFTNGVDRPRISSKVDVWSLGIIFYQMLFGIRPFGEGQTQDIIWTNKVIIEQGKYVTFPTEAKAPKISDEAKDLIRACLSFNYQDR